MPKYVDAFVVPVPRKNIRAYERMSKACAKIWREHGALEYRECRGDDLAVEGGPLDFPNGLRLKKGETVYFSWIVFRSRAQRDKANAKIMKDPRVLEMMNTKKMPFDCTRMLYGGFKTAVEA
jgi:uncharacterized protein YbaA (DUF1428 family)